MSKKVKIGDRLVGEGEPCFIVAEIGINHNGDVSIVRKLISAALLAGCDAVKFQKRTIDVVYTPKELDKPRENPFGTTNRDLKQGLEFGYEEYKIINEYCKSHNILWFASCWDEASVDFIEQFDPLCYKIASASLTDDKLLRYHRQYKRPILLSTGMSTLEQIDHAVEVLGTDDLIILHCTSTYPASVEELNLKAISMLKERYKVPVGYSGHEVGLNTTVAASVLGACMIERHITLDRAMWGSDQAASIEPHGFAKLVRDIHVIETAMGDGIKRVYESEVPIKQKLRRIGK
ncbi:MAG TPA: N-acetylneuraminate synthase family protein [Candidatus Wunengus sp. YC65]|uniref:N-acetylneuraminate synthase family protein n=1 Tax=Candidatus Wunengus sp. YC65 TaxID=3367701 RepID=UPI0040266B74